MHMVTFVNDKQGLHLCLILELPVNVTPTQVHVMELSSILKKY